MNFLLSQGGCLPQTIWILILQLGQETLEDEFFDFFSRDYKAALVRLIFWGKDAWALLFNIWKALLGEVLERFFGLTSFLKEMI